MADERGGIFSADVIDISFHSNQRCSSFEPINFETKIYEPSNLMGFCRNYRLHCADYANFAELLATAQKIFPSFTLAPSMLAAELYESKRKTSCERK